MKKYLPIIIVGLAIIVAALLVVNSRFQNDGALQDANEAVTALPERFETQTNTEGGVTAAILPKNISDDIWDFIVTLDTHSGALDEDILAVSVLVDDVGKEYGPVAWEGDPSGGHHREGILKFRALAQKPQMIKLVIRGIGGIKERAFIW